MTNYMLEQNLVVLAQIIKATSLKGGCIRIPNAPQPFKPATHFVITVRASNMQIASRVEASLYIGTLTN